MAANEQQGQTIRVDTLPNDKLDYLGKQLDVELGKLHQSANILRSLAQEYQTSGTAVHEIKDLEDGAACLLTWGVSPCVCMDKPAAASDAYCNPVIHMCT